MRFCRISSVSVALAMSAAVLAQVSWKMVARADDAAGQGQQAIAEAVELLKMNKGDEQRGHSTLDEQRGHSTLERKK